MPACSQTHSELHTPHLNTCIQLLLECPSPVRAQHPGPPDALTQSCRPSTCIQLIFLNYTRPDRCLRGSPRTLHPEGDTLLRGSVGSARSTASLLPPLGHSLSAFPSLGEAGSSTPVTCKCPVFALLHCLNKNLGLMEIRCLCDGLFLCTCHCCTNSTAVSVLYRMPIKGPDRPHTLFPKRNSLSLILKNAHWILL